MKTVIENANAGYQQINRSAKQVADVSGANLNAAAEQFAQASEKASGAAKSSAAK
jgi:methyl-accepting chemotaxis protein